MGLTCCGGLALASAFVAFSSVSPLGVLLRPSVSSQVVDATAATCRMSSLSAFPALWDSCCFQQGLLGSGQETCQLGQQLRAERCQLVGLDVGATGSTEGAFTMHIPALLTPGKPQVWFKAGLT